MDLFYNFLSKFIKRFLVVGDTSLLPPSLQWTRAILLFLQLFKKLFKKCRKDNRPIKYLRESRHTPNWKEVEILAKEKNIGKQKFKESAATSQEKKDNLLNKKEERVMSDIWSAIIPQIKVN